MFLQGELGLGREAEMSVGMKVDLLRVSAAQALQEDWVVDLE